jgi:hypothetical protein
MSIAAPPRIVLGPGLAGISLTPEEFDAIEEADPLYRYELINGRLIVTPPPLEVERRADRRNSDQPPARRSRHLGGAGTAARSAQRCADNRGRMGIGIEA